MTTKRRGRIAPLIAATLAAGIGTFASIDPAHACARITYCQSNYCAAAASVEANARSQTGAVWAQARLQSGAPTQTCLWYAVRVRFSNGQERTVYYNLNGQFMR